MIRVELTGTQALRAELQRIGEVLTRQALDKTAVEVERYIGDEAAKHNDTGALHQSVYKQRTPEGWEIGHDLRVARHAQFFMTGTGLHGPKARKFEIRPKNKKALHYAKGGVFWYWFGPKSPQEQATIRKWVKKKSGDNARIMFRWPQNPGMKKDDWLGRAAALAPQLFEQHVTRLMAAR